MREISIPPSQTGFAFNSRVEAVGRGFDLDVGAEYNT